MNPREYLEATDSERYREALRALEASSGRVVARLEIRWELEPDGSSSRAIMVATASTLEAEKALSELGIMILKGKTKYRIQGEEPNDDE